LSESSFPSESKEALGHVVGISEHCGHALTYKVLSSESDVIIYQSLLHPATTDDANVRACMPGGESPTHVEPLKDRSSMDKSTLASSPPSPIFNPEDLSGQTFLMDEQEDGQKFRGHIVELIEDNESKVEDNRTRIQFRVSVNEDKAEEIMTYNKMLGYITKMKSLTFSGNFNTLCLMSTKGHSAIF
jgi:hypothetical protein